MLALAILAGALAALGEVMRLADQNAELVEGETQAQVLAESVMAELLSGARPLSSGQRGRCSIMVRRPARGNTGSALEPTERHGVAAGARGRGATIAAGNAARALRTGPLDAQSRLPAHRHRKTSSSSSSGTDTGTGSTTSSGSSSAFGDSSAGNSAGGQQR